MQSCISVLLLACSTLVWAQHDHHSMATKSSSQARLEVQDNAAAQSLTIRVGPVSLLPKTDHSAVAQPPIFFLSVPFEGWITAYHPRLVDGSGRPAPSQLLHHVAFYNTARPDFLCPNKQEHIFGAGSELNDWPALPGFGYRVRQRDRIRISTMFHNPTATAYPQIWLEVKLEYRSAAQGEPLKSVYPAWFDVGGCGDSAYDLGPGRTLKITEFKLGFSGLLLGVGGHMHDHGWQLDLFNVTRGEDIAALKTQLDPAGTIQSMPIVRFTERGGYKLNKGDVLRVSSIYENNLSRQIPQGAMGIVVGYFLPENDAERARLSK